MLSLYFTPDQYHSTPYFSAFHVCSTVNVYALYARIHLYQEININAQFWAWTYRTVMLVSHFEIENHTMKILTLETFFYVQMQTIYVNVYDKQRDVENEVCLATWTVYPFGFSVVLSSLVFSLALAYACISHYTLYIRDGHKVSYIMWLAFIAMHFMRIEAAAKEILEIREDKYRESERDWEQ